MLKVLLSFFPLSFWHIHRKCTETVIMLQDLDAVASGKDDVVLLKEAITNGDIKTVEQLLDKGINSLHFVCDD